MVYDVSILGAGIAGLGAALRARELELKSCIFEASATSGGLLDNFEVESGFRFDNAVHLSFATEGKVRAIFDKTPYITHEPLARCFEQDKWLKHPVQNNLHPLEPAEKCQLINSFLERPQISVDSDYGGWLYGQYGCEIADRFHQKYTLKYWDTPASNLSTTWLGNRLFRADINEILMGAFSSDTPTKFYAKEMRYPRKGGYKAFIQPLIEQSEIKNEHKVVAIDTKHRTLEFSNGKTEHYKCLVSSIPLPVLIPMINDVPERVLDSAAKLEATSIDLLSVGFNKELINDLWFYIYDEDIFASRAYSPSVKSPDNCPSGCSSLQFEVYTRGRNSRYSSEELIENVKYAIAKMSLATESDILFIHHKRLPWGNVIFDHGMEFERQVVREFLDKREIIPCGRFGEWDYLWSNQSLLSGYHSLNKFEQEFNV
jgi:protoporphyrinogen oxidase